MTDTESLFDNIYYIQYSRYKKKVNESGESKLYFEYNSLDLFPLKRKLDEMNNYYYYYDAYPYTKYIKYNY